MFMYLFGKDLRLVLNFIGQKTILDLALSRAKSIMERAEENKGILKKLESEYQLFTDHLNRWTKLKIDRYEYGLA